MATNTLTDTDLQVRTAVIRQLDWDPRVDASAIGVAAVDGAVTLTGYIDTYAGKLAAERAAKRVRGVRAVANDLQVRLVVERSDADIASDAVQALELHGAVPDNVQAVVHSGHVTLTGNVRWMFQRHEAERALRHIRGVRSVANRIVVARRQVDFDVERRILKALHRDADIDAHRITVGILGETATLNGVVRTWRQREAAEQAAASAPGISAVDNHIVVEPTGEIGLDDEVW